jgi:hypothetical protein
VDHPGAVPITTAQVWSLFLRPVYSRIIKTPVVMSNSHGSLALVGGGAKKANKRSILHRMQLKDPTSIATCSVVCCICKKKEKVKTY